MDTTTIPIKLESAKIIDQLAKIELPYICPIFNLPNYLGDKLLAILNKAVSTISETAIVITRNLEFLKKGDEKK